MAALQCVVHKRELAQYHATAVPLFHSVYFFWELSRVFPAILKDNACSYHTTAWFQIKLATLKLSHSYKKRVSVRCLNHH